jgi:hypothetical protein
VDHEKLIFIMQLLSVKIQSFLHEYHPNSPAFFIDP